MYPNYIHYFFTLKKSKKIMDSIFKNWNFVRILRFAMGVFLLFESVKSGIGFLIFVGAIFTIMPLLNVGCCCTSSCGISRGKTNQNNTEVDFEEIQ